MLKIKEENNIKLTINESRYLSACMEIANEILQIEKNGEINYTKKDIFKVAKKASSKYNLSTIPKYIDILKFIPNNNQYFRQLLKVKPIRTSSGIAVITVMPMPFECPHGKCIYCPGGIEVNTPLSYIGTEPSTKYAQRVGYDSFLQVTSKLEQLYNGGHNVDKAEIVIVGGTFPFYPTMYQLDFVKKCFDALNIFDKTNNIQNILKNGNIKYYDSLISKDLEEAKTKNQNANIRCVGLTIETKPDYCKTIHVNNMLKLGATRIEIGVQSLNDEVYKFVNRGHRLSDVYEAFYASRNAGYKIVAHMMPGLPKSSIQKDIDDTKRLFEDEGLKPDMLKIYPTLVLKGTGLYKLYSENRYEGYTKEDLVKILIEIKRKIPSWVRIMRIQREIEPKDIINGPNVGNIRQLVLLELKKKGFKCNCIRCREVGLGNNIKEYHHDDLYLYRVDYYASKGKEIFISFESKNKDLIFGFLRLRILTDPQRKELCTYDRSKKLDISQHIYTSRDKKENLIYDKYINDTYKSAIIRELHVYGPLVTIGNKLLYENIKTLQKTKGIPDAHLYYQHKGLGKRLINEAERICKEEYHLNALSIISAVGTREYYKKFGYIINGPYVTKKL